MYTILMKVDKSLLITEKSQLYQREKLVDKIQFLVPLKYEELDLSDFTVLLKYVDQGNVAHAEMLTKDEEIYKEQYYRYTIDVDTNLNRFAGDIKLHLTFIHVETEDETLHEEVMHTGETTITISPLSDLYQFVADDALEVLDAKMVELTAKLAAADKAAETWMKSKADDILIYGDNLQVSSNGTPIGTGVKLSALNSD